MADWSLLAPVPAEFDVAPGTQEHALFLTNQSGGENDRQIKVTFDHNNFLLLRSLAGTGN